MIKQLCFGPEKMIDPFSEPVSKGVISYGLTSAGYDLRLADDLYEYDPCGGLIDPKAFKNKDYSQTILTKMNLRSVMENGYRNLYVILPPHSYCLGRTFEYIRMPRHLKGRCVGKSTLARAGILINTTPLEPGWEGNLTLEIGNVTPCPAKLYIGEGIAQLEFEMLSAEVTTCYKEKGGQYQGQLDVTPPRVKT